MMAEKSSQAPVTQYTLLPPVSCALSHTHAPCNEFPRKYKGFKGFYSIPNDFPFGFYKYHHSFYITLKGLSLIEIEKDILLKRIQFIKSI